MVAKVSINRNVAKAVEKRKKEYERGMGGLSPTIWWVNSNLRNNLVTCLNWGKTIKKKHVKKKFLL